MCERTRSDSASTYHVTRLVTLDPDGPLSPDAARATIESAATATRAFDVLVAPTLPGSLNGGDVVVHLRFNGQQEWDADRGVLDRALAGSFVASVNGAEYFTAGSSARGRRDGPPAATVYRTLLLRAEPRSAESTARFERDLLRMPACLPGMRSWQLSSVVRAEGATEWTHVWEQEFSDVDALTGPYMTHPIHWAVVDPWFDKENPDHLVRERVCHSFCALPRPLLSSAPLRG